MPVVRVLRHRTRDRARVRIALSWALLFALLASCAGPRVRSFPPPASWSPREGEGEHELAGVKADLLAAPGRLWDDLGLVASNGNNWLLMSGASAYAIAQEQMWEDQEEAWFKNHTIFSSTTQNILGALGNGATLYAGALAWYFLALEREDERSYEASKTMLSSLTLTAGLTGLLKVTFPDGRPNGGHHDFPSGHSSMSMAAAATLDELYGHDVGIPAYILSGLIGLQRLDTGKHDTGAVVFGWALGWAIGHTVAAHHMPRIFGMDVGLVIDPENDGVGISLTGGL